MTASPTRTRPPVNDDDLINLLHEISTMAVSKYPFGNGDGPLDPNLCITLGRIAGICDKAIKEYTDEAALPPHDEHLAHAD